MKSICIAACIFIAFYGNAATAQTNVAPPENAIFNALIQINGDWMIRLITTNGKISPDATFLPTRVPISFLKVLEKILAKNDTSKDEIETKKKAFEKFKILYVGSPSGRSYCLGYESRSAAITKRWKEAVSGFNYDISCDISLIPEHMRGSSFVWIGDSIMRHREYLEARKGTFKPM
jgi:hypothetical protein